MRDQFVGDKGDLGKYAMLRAIADGGSTGVVWYAQPDDAGPASSHGNRRTYEGASRRAQALRAIDPSVTSALQRLSRGRGSMRASASRRGLWPANTRFPGDHFLKVLRPNWRISWFEEALAQLGGRDVVLFDPDNGMAPSDRVTGAHATTEEVYRFLSSGVAGRVLG